MSSKRQLTDRIAWDEQTRAIELLDWETKPGDFDRLCQHVIDRIVTRAQITRDELYATISEPDLRREIRVAAEAFQEERHKSLVLYVGARLRFLVLPNARRRKD